MPRPTTNLHRLALRGTVALTIAFNALTATALADVGSAIPTTTRPSAASQDLLSAGIDNAWSITSSAGGKLAMIATAVGVLVALLVFKSWKAAISVFGAAVAASWVLGGGFWSTAQDTSVQLSQGIGGAAHQTATNNNGGG